jgi:hypothetical protein
LRTIALLGVPPEPPKLFRPRLRFPCSGDGKGGGFIDLAASQSNGVDEDIDGVIEGDWTYEIRLRGVDGVGEDEVEAEAERGLVLRGEPVAEAALLA